MSAHRVCPLIWPIPLSAEVCAWIATLRRLTVSSSDAENEARQTDVGEAQVVKNQSAEVSHSPSRIANRIPPAIGNAQPGNRDERTISTFATNAP